MLAADEIIMAFIRNVEQFPWDIYPTFEIDRETAEAIKDALKVYEINKTLGSMR